MMPRMSPNMIEAIICEVEKNPLIYDYTLVDYKDMQKKNLVWREIANKVGAKSGEIVAWKWKNLRDSYSKYKKHLLYPPYDENGHKAGLVNWRWAPFMTYLDPYMRKPRDTRGGNSPEPTAVGSFDDTTQPEVENIVSKPTETFVNSPEKEVNSSILTPISSSSFTPISSSSFTPISSSSNHHIKLENESSRKRKFLETIDEVIVEPFHQERPSSDRLDMTDYLFLNYSETFKKLGRKNQALLKMKMAKMFAEAELEELENDPIKCKVLADDSD